MITILATIFVLLVLVFIHELGHFVAARSVGIRVIRLSLGFPPRLFSFSPTSSGWIFKFFFFRKNDSGKLTWAPVVEKVFSVPRSKASETEYCIALIPVGGYVKMAGSIDESLEEDISGAPDELASKNKLQQIWVMSAGVLMNVLLAILIFTGIVFFSTGIPEVTNEPIVKELEPNYPAEAAGIQVGDKILSIDGKPVATWEEMSEIIHSKPFETISITWQQDGKIKTEILTVKEDPVFDGKELKTEGRVGMSGGYEIREATILESIESGFILTGRWFGVIVTSLKLIITGEVSFKQIGGPILIAQLAGQSAQAGLVPLLNLMAIISVNLAFINILPVPALDGGHILILLIEGITRRELSIKIRMIVQQVGMALLLLLILAIIYNDLTRLFFN